MAIEAARLKAVVTADTEPAERELRGFGARATNTLSGSFGGAGFSAGKALLGGLSGVLAGAGVLAIGRQLSGMVGQGLNLYSQQERLKQQLRSMSAMELVKAGGAENFTEGLALAGERAEELYGWMRKLAIQSPFSASDIAPMLRLGMVYGFNSDQAKRLTEATMNYGAAIGLTGPDMERVIRALGQMQTRGKVAGSEMMQLSEAGVPALEILAKTAGVTTAEMQKMIEKGIVQAGPAIEAITRSFEGYGGAAGASAESMGGMLASLKDIKDYALTDFLTPAFEAAKPALQAVVTLLSGDQFQGALKTMGETVGNLVEVPIDAFVGKLQQVMDIINPTTPMVGPMPSPASFGTWGFTTERPLLPDPDPERQRVDKWSEIIGVVTGWDVAGVQSTLDALFPKREGAEARTLGLPFDEMTNFRQWAFQMNQGTDPLNALMGTMLDQDMAVAQEKFRIKMQKFWAGVFAPGFLGDVGALLSAGFAELGADFQTHVWKPVVDWVTPLVWGLTQQWGVVSEWFTGNIWKPTVDWMGPILDPLSAAWTAAQTWLNEHIFHPTVSVDMTGLNYQQYYGGNPGSSWDDDGFQPVYPGGPSLGPGFARGTESALEGWSWVGEEGPELMYVPGKASIYDAERSKGLWKMLRRLPGFADGKPGNPSPWIPGQTSTFGDPSALLGEAATDIKKAAKELKAATGDFAGMLEDVPGLFGASPVTKEQMDLAELGVPQNFADDYLRQLTDEVLNGVDWAGVDIQEAAAAAGIDPNLPAQAILTLFKQAWNDSSLFANPANLGLINTDAVAAQMQKQADSEAGEANIRALFGLGDDALVASIAGLGLDVQTSLTDWLNKNGMPEAGAATAAALGAGVTAGAPALGGGVSAALTTWGTSADGQGALTSAGEAFANIISQAMVLKPTVELPGTPTLPPGAVALPEGKSGAGPNRSAQQVNITATLAQPHDVLLLANQVAKLIRQGRV